jgi:hypothetical protein
VPLYARLFVSPSNPCIEPLFGRPLERYKTRFQSNTGAILYTDSMHYTWGLRVLLSLGLVLAPAFAHAEWSGDWDAKNFREQIAALGSDAVQNLTIPVLVGVSVKDLDQNFGEARGGGTRAHEGLDIVAPKGTPVASPTEAVVIGVGDGPTSGIYVRTANPGGEIFVYMHLSAVADSVKPGTVLKRGQVLGFVGNTGNAAEAGAHLHFEIRKDGKATNPYPRLTSEFTADERVAALTNMGGASVPAVASATTEAAQAVEAVTKVAAQFTRDLELGMEGEDVKALQQFLNKNGFTVAASGVGSSGNETDYFGAKTQAAVAKYQKANGITPTAGYFGPKTRAHVAKLASL